MKKLIIGGVLVCTSLCASAQDVIVKKDGSTILSKVLEVNETNIKYKKFSNKTGPTYTIGIENVLSVNYENGEKETFKDKYMTTTTATTNSGTSQRYVQKKPDRRNAELLAFHNKIYQPTNNVKRKPKIPKYCTIIFGVKSSSIMSNEDLEMNFEASYSYWNPIDKNDYQDYHIVFINKTDGVIYIDKGNCFRQICNQESFCYYDNSEQTTVNMGGANGASLGLGSVANVLGVGGALGTIAGGVGIGGGSSHSTSTTYLKERVIAIPPHGRKRLTERRVIETKKERLLTNAKYKEIERAEYFIEASGSKGVKEYGITKGIVTQGEVKTFQENELPWERKYFFTYSTEEDFKTFSTLQTTLYIHEIIGIGKWNYLKYIEGMPKDAISIRCQLSKKM